MKLLALPYYASNSLQMQRIRNRITRYAKHNHITRQIEKGPCIKMKTCPQCKKTKDTEDFRRSINERGNRKRISWCIECRVIANRKYYYPATNRKYWQAKRIKAFKLIQDNIECQRCGCNDKRFLEINHIYGRDPKEAKDKLYNNIIMGRRKTDDLELLCRPCNHIHYLETKFGEKIPLKVVWEGNK